MAQPLVSDELWEVIEPLLPPEPPKPQGGRPRLSDRAALTGILFVLRSGIPWEMLPQEMGCGSGMTCWRRLHEWQAAGVWEKLHRLLLDRLREADQIDWSRAVVDSTSVRAVLGGGADGPQSHGSGAKRKQTSPDFGCPGNPSGGALDRGQRERRHAAPAFGGSDSPGARQAGPASPPARDRARGPRLQLRRAPTLAAGQEDPSAACGGRKPSWQRPGQHSMGSRTHLGLAAPFPPPAHPLGAPG